MNKNFYIIILFLILGAIYWKWFIPGPKVALDFPLVSEAILKTFLGTPKIWFETGGEGMGEYGVFTLWSYPASFISGILAHLNLNFSIIARLMFLFPLLIFGTFSIWKYCESLKFSNGAKFISALFYLSNTYILLIVDGGQLLISLAYAWFPFSFFMIEKSIGGSFKNKILAALSVTILGFLDIRFIFVLFLLSLSRFLFGFFIIESREWFNWIRKWISLGVISLVIFLGLNSYWIIAQIFVPLDNEVFTKLTQTFFTSSTNLSHPLLLISPHWFKNVFGVISPIRFEFIFIPILVFLSPILKPRNKNVAFWLVVSVIGVFLSKGSAEPFGEVYQWLFHNFPGFSLFRDSTKFFFLVSLSFAILIGLTVDSLLDKVRRFKRLTIIILSAFVIYFIYLASPIWQGLTSGTFSDHNYENEYGQIADFLRNDPSFGRVFWIPSSRPLTYSDPNHPIVEALRLVDKRPFSSSVLGTYEIFNYLREAPYMGELFSVSGIRYIVYPYLDPKRDDLHPDNIKYYYTFLDQLSNLPWLSRISNLSMPVFKVETNQDRFFATSNTWIIVGSDDIYNEATKSSNLSLSNNSLIFAEERVGLNLIDKFAFAKIVLYKKETLDLISSLISTDDFIFPAKDLNKDPNRSGWWKREGSDIVRWRDFLKTKYEIDNKDFDLGGGWAIAEGKLELSLKDEKISKDKILFARVMESQKGDSLSFYQGNNLIGKVNTNFAATNIRWFRVGELVSDQDIIVKTEGEINVLNALTLITQDKWKEYEEKMLGYQRRIKDFSDQNVSENNIKVTYEKINITEYKVRVEGLTNSSLLVFSENFNKGWKLNEKESIPVYSILNGFMVEKNGEYLLRFEPQKYIFPGLIISTLAGVLILIILWRLK